MLSATIALAIAAVPASADALAPPAAAITVKQGSVFHFFRLFACRVDAAGFHAYGSSASASGVWKLLVRIQPFSGYHSYDIEYGDNQSAANFIVDPPTGRSYSNGNEPPTDQRRLTVGGAVAFVGGRTTMGVQFPITYDGAFPRPKIVNVYGRATCHYPRPRR
jgi:hypothetical protein